MKKLALVLFVLCASILFFTGCGGGGSDYDKYEDPTNDVDNSGNETDTGKTDPTDTDKEEIPDDNVDTEPSEDDGDTANDNDSDDSSPADFWSTCEGIIACTNGCLDDDSDCTNSCYQRGTDDEQLYYRRWRECFDDKCAGNKTAECSAENCGEWDEKCNVASAFEHEVTVPAPYGDATFSGNFHFILNDSFPTAESQLKFENFASGKISTTPITPGGTIISFVKTANDPRDGKVVEVHQVQYDVTTKTFGNPVVILRIKESSATEGSHTVGVSDESEARLIVGEVDSLYNITCYHAFGTGSFKISKAVIEIGASGNLSFSNGTAELFNPQNIPELGGDATEILGVSSCSLIY